MASSKEAIGHDLPAQEWFSASVLVRELRADLYDGIRVFHSHALGGHSFSSPVDFSQQPGRDALPTPIELWVTTNGFFRYEGFLSSFFQ
ncbi:hypothetical protein CEP51_016281 [Fusarium floridanum]|uniref:Uncharacterized protein n=1 Tax=Fusarium floridanum TaxID=1325733 RepID=A0A428NTF8_9HYPO|nr:hypothetical protein CEP51_016281 [Fusarium floridanum]